MSQKYHFTLSEVRFFFFLRFNQLSNAITLLSILIANCSTTCFNGGTCFYPGKCICPPGLEGEQCEISEY